MEPLKCVVVKYFVTYYSNVGPTQPDSRVGNRLVIICNDCFHRGQKWLRYRHFLCLESKLEEFREEEDVCCEMCDQSLITTRNVENCNLCSTEAYKLQNSEEPFILLKKVVESVGADPFFTED